MDSKKLRQQADKLFSDRQSLMMLWQEEAENFYPERADFTYKRYLGTDWAANLMTSYPCLCRRDLGDQFETMLRNAAKPWFSMTVDDPRVMGHEEKAWLQWATDTQRRTMYHKATHFTQATKLGDHDYATFGNNAIQITTNSYQNGLMYRCHHLRDIVWVEDEDGNICAIYRKFKPSAYWLASTFKPTAFTPGRSVHTKVTEKAKKDPFETVNCIHMMVKADLCDEPSGGKPWRSVYFDCDNDHEMESIAKWTKEYVISRWARIGSQYAHSPAVVIALPEARLLQAMTVTLLEAGEKIVNPPMAAVEGAVRSDMAVYAGGVTWVEYDYQYPQHALIPMTTDAKGMPLSIDMQKDSRNMLAQCFYLNKLRPFLPSDKEMTAFQAGEVVAQYVRDALPLFAPMEDEYNGGICEETFSQIWHARGFGPVEQIPKKLLGADITFAFQSPLHEAIEQIKGQKFLQMTQLTAQAVGMDKNAAAVPNTIVAFRDALEGIGIPQRWQRSDVEVKQMQEQAHAEQMAAQALQSMQAGADVVQTLSGAQKDSAMAEAA